MTLHEDANDRYENYLANLAREGHSTVPEDAMCEVSGLWMAKYSANDAADFINAWDRTFKAIVEKRAKANDRQQRDEALGDVLDAYVRKIANADLAAIADEMSAGPVEPEMRNPFDDPVELVG